MGSLAGFRYRDIAARLRNLGFVLERQAKGSHQIWRHPETGMRATLYDHAGDLPENTLRSTLKKAGISLADFLA